MPAAIPIAIAAGAVGSALISKSAAQNAADAQAGAAANATQAQLQMYNQSRADQSPWRQAGGQAVNALSQWYGLGGLGPSTAYGDQAGITGTPTAGYDPSSGYRIGAGGMIGQEAAVGGAGYGASMFGPGSAITANDPRRTIQPVTGPAPRPGTGQQGAVGQQPIDYQKLLSSLPGYQFQLSQGENAVNSNLAARGLLQSGAAGKALTQYGQGVASDYATQYINGLQSLAGLGQTSAANTGALGGQAAGQIGSNMLYGGNAQASGYVGQANAINSGLSGLVGAYGQYRTQQNQLYNQQYDQLQPYTPGYIPRATDPYQDPYAYGGGP